MDVVVAGAGVGGLALARGMLLHAPDAHVRVLEQAGSLRSGGAAVTIFSNGAAALAGIGAPLGGLGGRIDTMRFLTHRGRAMFTVDLTVMARKTGFPVATVPRQRLIAHLASGLPEGVVEFGRGSRTSRSASAGSPSRRAEASASTPTWWWAPTVTGRPCAARSSTRRPPASAAGRRGRG